MTERVTDKIKKAIDTIFELNGILYVEIRLMRTEYQEVWNALNELKIFDIDNIHVKILIDDFECRLIIGAGDLK